MNKHSATSYVVRIYRRTSGSDKGLRCHDAISLAGIVERSDNGERQDFHDIEQLWAILCEEKNERETPSGEEVSL